MVVVFENNNNNIYLSAIAKFFSRVIRTWISAFRVVMCFSCAVYMQRTRSKVSGNLYCPWNPDEIIKSLPLKCSSTSKLSIQATRKPSAFSRPSSTPKRKGVLLWGTPGFAGIGGIAVFLPLTVCQPTINPAAKSLWGMLHIAASEAYFWIYYSLL